MKVIGFKEVDRVSQKTGRAYKALNIYVTYQSTNITGEGCEVLFVMQDSCYPGIAIGDRIRVSYNRWGNIEAVEREL